MSGLLIDISAEYSVVVLPEPVGPVHSKIPFGLCTSSRIASTTSSRMPSVFKSSVVEPLSSKRITIRSPCAVGIVERRKSMSRPATLMRMRPSCGRRFSAMFSPPMILTRLVIDAWNFLEVRTTSFNTPSRRNRTSTYFSIGSMCTSDTRSLAAWLSTEFTSRMIGASSSSSRMSLAASSSSMAMSATPSSPFSMSSTT